MKRLACWVLGCLAITCIPQQLFADPPAHIADPTEMPPPCEGSPHFSESDRHSTFGWVTAEVELYLLKPFFTNDPAFTTTLGAGTLNPAATTTDFDWNLNAAPAVVLAWVSDCGLGVRSRYFQLDDSSGDKSAFLSPTAAAAGTTISGPVAGLPTLAQPITFGAPGGLATLAGTNGLGLTSPGDNLAFGSSLTIDTWDLEGLYQFGCGPYRFAFSGGGRYQFISQKYHGSLAGSADSGSFVATETQSLVATHNFIGGGPTTAFEARIALPCRHLYIFGSARGSLLVGTSREYANFTQSIVDPDGIAGGTTTIGSAFSRSRDTILPVVELELGLEYRHNFGWGYGYFRSAVVDQTYFNAGSASQTSGDMSLFGLQATMGFTF